MPGSARVNKRRSESAPQSRKRPGTLEREGSRTASQAPHRPSLVQIPVCPFPLWVSGWEWGKADQGRIWSTFQNKNTRLLDGGKKKLRARKDPPGQAHTGGPGPCVTGAAAPPRTPSAQVTALTFAEAGHRRACCSPGKVT